VNIRKLALSRSNRVLSAVEARVCRLIKRAKTSAQNAPWTSLVDYMKNNNVTVKALQTRIGWLSMEPKNRQALQSSIAGYDEKRIVDEEVLNSLVNFLYQNENIKNDFMRAVQSSWLLPRVAKDTLVGALNWRLDQMRQQQNRMQPAQQDMLQPGPSQSQSMQDIEKRLNWLRREQKRDIYYDPEKDCHWVHSREGNNGRDGLWHWIKFDVPNPMQNGSRRLTPISRSEEETLYRDDTGGYWILQHRSGLWSAASARMGKPSYDRFDPQRILAAQPAAKQNLQQLFPAQTK